MLSNIIYFIDTPHRARKSLLGFSLCLFVSACSEGETPNNQIPTLTVPEQSTGATASLPPQSTGAASTTQKGPGSATGAEPSTATSTTGSPSSESTSSTSNASSTSSTGASSTMSTSTTTSTSSSVVTTDASSTSDDSSSSTQQPDPPPPPRKLYTEGHGDIAVYFEKSKEEIRVAIDVDDSIIDGVLTTQEFPVNALRVRSAARFVRPMEDPQDLLGGVCVPKGQSVAWFPQNNTDCRAHKTPFLGWANRIRPRDLKDEFLKIKVIGVDSPVPGGHMSVWYSKYPPEFMVSTCDGFEGDEVRLYSGHDHFNIGFAGAPGLWTAHFRVELAMKTTGKSYQKIFSVEFLVE